MFKKNIINFLVKPNIVAFLLCAFSTSVMAVFPLGQEMNLPNSIVGSIGSFLSFESRTALRCTDSENMKTLDNFKYAYLLDLCKRLKKTFKSTYREVMLKDELKNMTVKEFIDFTNRFPNVVKKHLTFFITYIIPYRLSEIEQKNDADADLISSLLETFIKHDITGGRIAVLFRPTIKVIYPNTSKQGKKRLDQSCVTIFPYEQFN